MNNWRLLLFALVAVFQPIASFTERNFVDGRHQCCDRQSRSLLRDSTVHLYGTDRFTKPTEERRIIQRDEVRAYRRHEDVRNYDPSSSRSSDTFSRRIRERDTSEITSRSSAQTTRTEVRLDRNVNERNRERILSRDAQLNNEYRRVVRDYRDRNNRISESSRLPRVRDHTGAYERISRYSPDARYEIRRTQIRSQELRTASPARESRIVQARNNVARIHEDSTKALRDRRQVRERLEVTGRESYIRVELQRNADNKRRVLQLSASLDGNRRLFSPDARASDVQVRLNLPERRASRDARVVATTRIDQRRQLGEDYKRVSDRKISLWRSSNKADEADVRSRINIEGRRELRDNEMRLNQRAIDSRREIRNDVHERDTRKTIVANKERILIQREARIGENRHDRNNERRSRKTSTESRRNTERISHRDTRDTVRVLTERNIEDRRENSRVIRNNEIRENRVVFGEQNNERRREIRSSESDREHRIEMRDSEKRFRERNSDSRNEIRNTDPSNDNRAVRQSSERNSDSRLERSADSIRTKHRDIRDNERRFRERSNESRRDIRSAEGVSVNRRNIRNDVRHVQERYTGSQNEIRSVSTIREDTRATERQHRENRDNVRSLIDNHRAASRNNKREFREDGHRYVDRSSVSRRNNERVLETSRDNERKFRETRDARAETRNAERRFRENRDATIVGNRREVRMNQDLREVRKARVNEQRVDSRLNRALEKDTVLLQRRARSMEPSNSRDNRAQVRVSRSGVSRERDASRTMMKFYRGTIDARIRNDEFIVNHNSAPTTLKKGETNDESVIANWQYVLYTLQGIYLCGLLVQMLAPSNSEKSKSGNWLQLPSQRLIKVD